MAKRTKSDVASPEELALLLSSIASMHGAGVLLEESVHVLAESYLEHDVRMQSLLLDVCKSLKEGNPLSKSLETVGLIDEKASHYLRTGEQTGRLEEALASLSESYESQAIMRERFRFALRDSMKSSIASLAITTFAAAFVMPELSKSFSDLSEHLIGASFYILGFGTALVWVLVVLSAFVFMLFLTLSVSSETNRGFATVMKTVSGVPGLSKLFTELDQASFLSSVAMGISAGETDEEAVLNASDERDEVKLYEALSNHQDPKSLPAALLEDGLITPEESQILAVKKLTYGSGSSLKEIAETKRAKAFASIESAIARFDSLMVNCLVIVLMFVVLSVMLPMVGMALSL